MARGALGPLANDLDATGMATMSATLDGFFLHALLADEPPTAAALEAVLRRAFAAATG